MTQRDAQTPFELSSILTQRGITTLWLSLIKTERQNAVSEAPGEYFKIKLIIIYLFITIHTTLSG